MVNQRSSGVRWPLLAALATGLAVWLLWPARPWLWAGGDLPGSEPGRQQMAARISAGHPRAPLPREPMAVAVLPDGELLVADVGLAQVHRFSADGRLRASYAARGAFSYPVGLAVGEEGQVWVADLWAERVFRLDLGNDAVEEVPRMPSGYRAPGALAYRHGLLYLADLARHQVLVLSPDGELARVIGEGKGGKPGQLAFPNGVWVATSGEVFVADSDNHRLQVFDAAGRLSRVLQPHRLLLPRGLVQDARGRLHVADSLANDIAVLDPAGQIVARYGLDEELSAPNGLAARGSKIYVADRGNGRVVAWEVGDGR